MPTCCRCNGSGHCVSCKKSGKPCTDCLPSRKGCCRNLITTAEPTVHTPLEMVQLLTVEATQAEATQAGATQNAYLTPSEITRTPVIPNDAHLPPYPQVCSPCFKLGGCAIPYLTKTPSILKDKGACHMHRKMHEALARRQYS